MVRVPLSPEDRERGERLGALLREARGARSIGEVAAAADISPETLRKIETGRIPTPAFFTVAALATTLGVDLGTLAACRRDGGADSGTAPGPARRGATPAA